MRYLEPSALREGWVQRVLAVLRGAGSWLGPTRPRRRARDISAEAIDEDEAYLARNPGVRRERRVLACMRSLAHKSPAGFLEATYGRDVVDEASRRLRADQSAATDRRSVANG